MDHCVLQWSAPERGFDETFDQFDAVETNASEAFGAVVPYVQVAEVSLSRRISQQQLGLRDSLMNDNHPDGYKRIRRLYKRAPSSLLIGE